MFLLQRLTMFMILKEFCFIFFNGLKKEMIDESTVALSLTCRVTVFQFPVQAVTRFDYSCCGMNTS